MDHRDPMVPSSFYTQRGIPVSGSGTLSGIHESAGYHPMTSSNMLFQSDMRGSMGSTISVEPSSAISFHGINVVGPSALPPSDPVKRKRGRPRKYGPDGSVSLTMSPSPSTSSGIATPTDKKNRGRPLGSGKKQQLASLGERLSASAGMGFTPHVILIAEGEDIVARIMSFRQQESRAVCVLSANGSVSSVALRQPSISSGLVRYEGLFDIIFLLGSYLPNDSDGYQNGSGSLSVSLASAEGCVINGGVGVGGRLVAASPVQVVVGSFICGSLKANNKKRDAAEGPTESSNQLVDNPVVLDFISPNQNLTSTSSMEVWPTTRNTHIDIDLMRG